MAERRFLVVRLGSLGDLVHTFPAVAALRKSFPAAEIIWVTHPRWKRLVESSGVTREVWSVDTRSLSSVRDVIGRVRRGNWDAAIDYQGLWKSAALPLFGGVARRIGFSSETIREYGVPLLYSERVKATAAHIAEQNGELSVRAGASSPVGCVSLAIPADDQARLDAHLRESEIGRYVVLSPGGGWRSKCWPPERFGLLCRNIRDGLGLRSIVNYGPGEEGLACAVRAASGEADPLLYKGTIGELMALLRNATCVVGGDTGPLHLGVALGTGVVALFGPTDPARNGPYRCEHLPLTTDIVLRSPAARTSHKRREQPDRSMLALSVESVFEAVQRCIGAKS